MIPWYISMTHDSWRVIFTYCFLKYEKDIQKIVHGYVLYTYYTILHYYIVWYLWFQVNTSRSPYCPDYVRSFSPRPPSRLGESSAAQLVKKDQSMDSQLFGFKRGSRGLHGIVPPRLSVGFLFLVVHSWSASRLLLLLLPTPPPAQLTHTNLPTHNLPPHNLLTRNLPTRNCSHTAFWHTTYPHTQLTHTTVHTQLAHNLPTHTQLTHTHTQLLVTRLPTHNLLRRENHHSPPHAGNDHERPGSPVLSVASSLWRFPWLSALARSDTLPLTPRTPCPSPLFMAWGMLLHTTQRNATQRNTTQHNTTQHKQTNTHRHTVHTHTQQLLRVQVFHTHIPPSHIPVIFPIPSSLLFFGSLEEIDMWGCPAL